MKNVPGSLLLLIIYEAESKVIIKYFSLQQTYSNTEIVIPFDEFNQEDFMAKCRFENILVLDAQFLTRSGQLIVTSDSIVPHINDFISKYAITIIGAEEYINFNGGVELELSESSINKILRQIFKHKIKNISICLLNSCRNQKHEIVLKNILGKAGYKPNISSARFNLKK